MKSALLTSILLLAAATAWAAEGDLTPVACSPELALQNNRLWTGPFTRPDKDAGTVNPHAVVARVRGEMGAVAVVAIDSRQTDAKAPDVLRLDFTGQGRFAGAPVVPLTLQSADATNRQWGVGPATLQVKRDGRDIPVWVEGNYYKGEGRRYLRLRLTTALAGRLTFGGKSYSVRVVDGDGNLLCGQGPRTRKSAGQIARIHGGDTLAIDTGDGSFKQDGQVIMAYFGHPVRVGGAWYNVSLSADRKRIAATPSMAKTAKLKIAQESWSATLAGEKHIIKLAGSRKPVIVPADRYTLVEFSQSLRSTGKPDEGLSIFGRGRVGPREAVIIDAAPGKTVAPALGWPVTAAITAKVASGKVSMDFKFTDAAGQAVQLLIPTRRRKDPQVKVLDAAGKSVHTGKFEYG